MTVEVKVGDAGEIKAVVDSLVDARSLLEGIGALMQGRAVAAFRQQKRGRKSWAPRMTPNVAGIVRDLNAGGFPKSRRFEPRPAVIDTGLLRNSITFAVDSSGRSVTIGTNVSYAVIQNEGGESQVELTSSGREQLGRWARRNPDQFREAGVGWLFNKPSFVVNVRERRFLDVDREDRKIIIAEIEREIGRLSRGS